MYTLAQQPKTKKSQSGSIIMLIEKVISIQIKFKGIRNTNIIILFIYQLIERNNMYDLDRNKKDLARRPQHQTAYYAIYHQLTHRKRANLLIHK